MRALEIAKLTYLKIRTQYFLRLRNGGFKKVWLRKQFATRPFEDFSNWGRKSTLQLSKKAFGEWKSYGEENKHINQQQLSAGQKICPDWDLLK